MKQKLKLTTDYRVTVHQILGTRLANIIKLSEKEFNQFINEIESNPLFEKLRYERVVKYKRFPKTDFQCNFSELNENIFADHTSVDVQSILETKRDTIQTIKEIGIEKFKKYFLYNEYNISNDEIKEKCGIGIDKVKKIIDLLNEVSIYSEFYNSPRTNITTQIKYNKIASISKDNDDFVINFFSPNLARGRYEINYDKVRDIKDRNVKSLVRRLELANLRKTNVYQILEKLVFFQKDFLDTGNLEKKILLTQKMLSKEICIDSSIVCRIIKNRSIENPSGKEIPLKDFFCNKKDIKKLVIKKVIEKSKEHLSTEKIRWILIKDYKIDIPRRSIAYYIQDMPRKCPDSEVARGPRKENFA
ncbi:MAG: hypothetical protein V1833_04705 [Elusimicrobiota bacterium]